VDSVAGFRNPVNIRVNFCGKSIKVLLVLHVHRDLPKKVKSEEMTQADTFIFLRQRTTNL
jgi:hypothetical protein